MDIIQAYTDLVATLDRWHIPSIPGYIMILTWIWVHKAARNNNRRWLAIYYSSALVLLYSEKFIDHLILNINLGFYRLIFGPLAVVGFHYVFFCKIGRHFSFLDGQDRPSSKSLSVHRQQSEACPDKDR